jgi:hypothetical protein
MDNFNQILTSGKIHEAEDSQNNFAQKTLRGSMEELAIKEIRNSDEARRTGGRPPRPQKQS